MEVFSQCLSPVRIYNRYTRHHEYVSCGRCPACLNRRSSGLSTRVRNEILSHRYSLFFTLTYDNDSIPRFEIFDDLNGNHQIRPTGRLAGTYSSYPLAVPSADNPKQFQLSPDTFVPHIENDDVVNEFGVCSKYDVQCFVKRVRYKISKFKINNNEKKFRYFVCSEYGPKTFRPHYHGVFLFDSEKLLSPLEDAVVTSWGKFERQDGKRNLFVFRPFASTSLTRAHIKLCDPNTAYYVADYVAGSDYLPEVLRHPLTRPFTLYSQNPCFGSFKADREAMLRDVSRGAVTRSVAHVEKNRQCVSVVDLPYTKSDICSVFRKCAGFRSLSPVAKSNIYSFVYDRKKEWSDEVGLIASACGYGSLKKFIRKNKEYSLRNFLKSRYYELYLSLDLDTDANWYASTYCCTMIERYSIFRTSGFASPVDCYLYLMDRCETLKKSYVYGQFVTNLNSWISKKGPAANLAAYHGFSDLMFSGYRYFHQLPHVYRNFLEECRLKRSCVHADGRIDFQRIQDNAECNSPVFLNFETESVRRFNERRKSKKANNSVLHGLRKMA